jgi:MoxR-like ATPase
MKSATTKHRITTGPELVRAIEAAYRAGIPFKLEGDHGIGKTESVAAAAKRLGVGFLSLNLAAMEPSDLVGLPQPEGDQVHYLPPPWLRTVATDTGGGLLLLDEINRIPRFIVAPLHQMLTERSINGVRFQPGWLPCAAANVGASYDVSELDPALESRFLTIRATASVASWVPWARAEKLDRRVVDFVASTPDIFVSSSPRDWTNVARLMREADALPPPMLEALVAGLVGDSFATAFVAYASSVAQALTPEAVLNASGGAFSRVQAWRDDRDLAMLAGTSRLLQAHLQSQAVHDGLSSIQRRHAITFVSWLPAELRRQWNVWAEKCGYQTLIVSKKRAA